MEESKKVALMRHAYQTLNGEDHLYIVKVEPGDSVVPGCLYEVVNSDLERESQLEDVYAVADGMFVAETHEMYIHEKDYESAKNYFEQPYNLVAVGKMVLGLMNKHSN